jgi:hypothetical protein
VQAAKGRVATLSAPCELLSGLVHVEMRDVVDVCTSAQKLELLKGMARVICRSAHLRGLLRAAHDVIAQRVHFPECRA